jgi:Reverse transcriptase (RNA-dependent DNA polymerase)
VQVVDVRGAFLKGRFSDGERLYLCVPEGFEGKYENNFVLHLQKSIYDLKQTAIVFWKELLTAYNSMGFKRSNFDPCLYFRITNWLNPTLNIDCRRIWMHKIHACCAVKLLLKRHLKEGFAFINAIGMNSCRMYQYWRRHYSIL